MTQKAFSALIMGDILLYAGHGEVQIYDIINKALDHSAYRVRFLELRENGDPQEFIASSPSQYEFSRPSSIIYETRNRLNSNLRLNHIDLE